MNTYLKKRKTGETSVPPMTETPQGTEQVKKQSLLSLETNPTPPITNTNPSITNTNTPQVNIQPPLTLDTNPTPPITNTNPPPDLESVKKHLQSLTLAQLKTLCHTYNLKVGGRKAELVKRLIESVGHDKIDLSSFPNKKASKKTGKGRMQLKTVDKLLENLKVKNVGRVSRCLKGAIGKGFINMDVDDPLDQVIYQSTCPNCSNKDIITVTVRQLLYQDDFPGLDYEEGGQGASIKCKNCDNGIYVTSLCEGAFQFDSGKFHNHCKTCKGFGKCIHDYRNTHCDNCGKHYFAGLQGLPCDCQRGDDESGEGCMIM